MLVTQSTSAPRTRATIAVLIAALALVAGCTSNPPTARPSDAQMRSLESRAQAAAQSGNTARAADLYAELAAGSSGTARSGYLLESARFALASGDEQTARRRLADGRQGASRDQQQSITVMLAELELRDRRPQAALDLLAALEPPVAAAAQRDAAGVRGRALFQLGRYADAVRALVDREVWLESSAEILANQRLIWDGFGARPPAAPLAPTGDPVVDGWLALAPIAADESADLRRSLLAWRSSYPNHPAAGVLLADLLAAQRTAGFPAQIALLLPLTSPQRAFAVAIRDGFLAAHLRHGNADATAIRIYDTGQAGSENAYERAQLEGADFVVGPLLRQDVDRVISRAGFVPTLALNLAQTETQPLRSFYQFSLSPDDEARAIADAIVASGGTTAIAFVPNSERGRRTLASFRAELEARGGQLLDFVGYDSGSPDFSTPVIDLLNIARSSQRERRLAANLGLPLEFEPRRRQDVDAIFITADDARAARLLAPQLRLHYAGDIPTYATSDVYDPGGAGGDNDLNGVIFTHSPAVVTPNAEAADLRREIDSFWPQRQALLRYYAMGFDAYELVGALYAGGSGAWPLQGMSGDLSLDERGRIHRAPVLAQMRNGRPVAYEPSSAPAGRELVGTR